MRKSSKKVCKIDKNSKKYTKKVLDKLEFV